MQGTTFFILALFGTISSVWAEGRLLDRLVLEVNGKAYTQRQVEVYTMVRTLAMGRPSREGIVGPDTWQGALQTFQEEALLLEMGMTAGDHVATQTEPQEFAKLVELVRRAQENEASLQSFLKDFRISEAELRAAIVALVRVQIVLNQRQTQVSREGNWLSLDSKSQWYIDQKQSIAVRAYEQASTYRRLQERRR